MKKTGLSLLLSVMVLLIGLWQHVQAVAAAGAGFTVNAVLPENHYGSGIDYFDLVMTPGQTETLTVKVHNLEHVNKTIKATADTGYTADGMQENYDRFRVTDEVAAVTTFARIFDGTKVIELAPNETKEVQFTVKMPTEGYKGILEGALYFEDQATTKQTTDQSNLQINNRYSMALGVVLRESREIHAAPRLHLKKIQVSKSNYLHQPAILMTFMNSEPATASNLTIKTSVTKNGKVVFGNRQTGRSFAANSTFKYGIPTGDGWVTPGTYHLKTIISNHQQKWTFKQSFKITTSQAIAINRQNKKMNWFWWIVLAIIILLLLLGLMYYLGTRRRKQAD